ncbi:DUF4170 domain-containing protein [Mycobacterium sp. NBC_00419]|uniref:hypothetical protein n=1 Tax=Mycobacterium sp. NBC_00419 TaxID=2975989 RepID=UPI002E1E9986
MTALALEFEPDAATLRLLGSEHQNGTWVGRELLPIANRIRNQGGDEDDYYRWVQASTLWTSYICSTSDSATEQGKHLESAWDKSAQSKPFELDDALADLEDRISSAAWPGRAGRRNQTVALAFVGYCRDRNCFTRTLSRYELAKHTPGLSPDVVGKGLTALVQLGLLDKEDRTDRRPSSRSTSRYRINLYWHAGSPGDSHLGQPNGINKSRSTSKYSLTSFCQLADNVSVIDLSVHDLWSRNGLGQSARQVWSALPEYPGCAVFAVDDPASVFEDDAVDRIGKYADELAAETGWSRRTVDNALTKLFDNCMAVAIAGRPRRWFRAAQPPVEPLAQELGCAGALADQIDRIEQRQQANRVAYPSSYTNHQSQEGITGHG